MRVRSYSASLGEDEVKINAQFETNDYKEGMAFRDLILSAFTTGKEIDCEFRQLTPEKIFRCGDVTTVIWKDGTKTIVKLMPRAEDSDYGAFTAALAKKIYGGNSKVMKYAGMVQRVKNKAEKKAERKAKHKAESENQGMKKYIVSQYGQVAECKGIETEEVGIGEKVIVFANDEGEARCKAVGVFRKSSLLKEFLVLSNGSVTEMTQYASNCFGYWEISLLRDDTYKIRVFAKNAEEAKNVFSVTPAPIPF